MVGQVLISRKFYAWLAGSNLVLPTPNMSNRRYLLHILCFSFYLKMKGNKRYSSTVHCCFCWQFTSHSPPESCFPHSKKENMQFIQSHNQTEFHVRFPFRSFHIFVILKPPHTSLSNQPANAEKYQGQTRVPTSQKSIISMNINYNTKNDIIY